MKGKLTERDFDRVRMGAKLADGRAAHLVSRLMSALPNPEFAAQLTSLSMEERARVRDGDPDTLQKSLAELITAIKAGDHSLFREIASYIEAAHNPAPRALQKELFMRFAMGKKVLRRRDAIRFVAIELTVRNPRFRKHVSHGNLVDADNPVFQQAIRDQMATVKGNVAQWIDEYNLPTDGKRGRPPAD